MIEVSFHNEVNKEVHSQLTVNTSFFIGRTTYSTGQSLLLSRTGLKWYYTTSIGVGSFGIASYGRALNLYDAGVRDAVDLVSRSISGR